MSDSVKEQDEHHDHPKMSTIKHILYIATFTLAALVAIVKTFIAVVCWRSNSAKNKTNKLK